MRLPDTTVYTDIKLTGYPESTGTPEAPEFSQGEDISFKIYLQQKNHEPLSPDKWNIHVLVKKNIYAKTTVWEGTLDNGVYKHNSIGCFNIIIPSEVTSMLPAGTYWMTLQAKQRLGQGEIKDQTIDLISQPFIISYTASSPHPDIKDVGERTYPPFFDSTKA